MAKHTIAEWFEMYEEITLQALESALERHIEAKADPTDKEKQRYRFPSEPDMEAWGNARRSFSRSLARVKIDFVDYGRLLEEDMEREGPVEREGPNGLTYAFWDPSLEPRVRFWWFSDEEKALRVARALQIEEDAEPAIKARAEAEDAKEKDPTSMTAFHAEEAAIAAEKVVAELIEQDAAESAREGECIELRGEDAVTACAFVQWWKPYCVGPNKNKNPKKRLIGPGDPDFERYMNAKKADQG